MSRWVHCRSRLRSALADAPRDPHPPSLVPQCVLERGRQFEQRHAAAVVGELEDYELERPRMQRMLSILRESLEFRDADWAALFAGRDVAVPGDAAASVAGSRASAASDSSSAVGGVARPRTGATAATVAAVLMSGGTEDG